MRVSQFLLTTHKESPADAELISHQLMLRAGLIRQLGAGLYTWLPLGLRVLKKIEVIVREAMNQAGAHEILMPMVQPAELWQETGRWESFGSQLLKAKDRNQREFCLGPTHEEVITDLIRREIRSYKQLPQNFYQIQTKFRDEIRPRFGVMRAREFLMKDAYSFHIDYESLEQTYQKMYQTYCHIFDKIGLHYRSVQADPGTIGGKQSMEFQVLADSGEDIIAYSDQSNYAANIELAQALPPRQQRPLATEAITLVEVGAKGTTTQLADFFKVAPKQILNTTLVHGVDDNLVALTLRGDHTLNHFKAEKLKSVITPLKIATPEEITTALGCQPYFVGPVKLPLPTIVDHSATQVGNFICGANQPDKYYHCANWERDANFTEAADIRYVLAGDPSPDGNGTLKFSRGIEVGHIFQLGDKYSRSMQANVLDKKGHTVPLMMGCYGLGISRIVAATIEQNHDANGIIWPDQIAPFQLSLVPINQYKSKRLREAVNKLYEQLINAGYQVLYDDRKERPGVMFADMDLIGIPHRLVLSEKNLDANTIEYKHRRANKHQIIKQSELFDFLRKLALETSK